MRSQDSLLGSLKSQSGIAYASGSLVVLETRGGINSMPLYAFVCVCSTALPGVERVLPGDDVGTVPTDKHFDAVEERADVRLECGVLLDD